MVQDLEPLFLLPGMGRIKGVVLVPGPLNIDKDTKRSAVFWVSEIREMLVFAGSCGGRSTRSYLVS